MTVVVIFKDDLDNKTVKQVETPVGKKVGAPGAEIEVLDSINRADTDTHYYSAETKYLKHIETGAVWAAELGSMKERAAPRNEELTLNSQEGQFVIQSDVVTLSYQPVSAISGNHLSPVNEVVSTAGYENAKAFNDAHKTTTYAYTNTEYFADGVEGKPKILATTFELPYPELPYRTGKAEAYLTTASYDGHVELVITESDERQTAEAMEKTYHYKYTDINDKVYEGTKVSASHNLSVSDFEPTVPWYMITNAEYSVEPFHVSGFFFDEEIAPAKATAQNLVDHL